MTGRMRCTASFLALLIAVSALLTACGDGDDGLTRAEVEEIVRAEMADAPTEADVERIVQAAVADALRPEPELSRAEVEEIVRAAIAAIPAQGGPRPSTPASSWTAPSPDTRPRALRPPSPTTTEPRAWTASGTCSSSTRTTW